MKKPIGKFTRWLLLALWGVSFLAHAQPIIRISFPEALKIGIKIWYNESGGSIDGLTSWNDGEDFASLGIGHFIWYPDDGAPHYFQESFPQLLKYMEARGVTVPYWLQGRWADACPWPDRGEFLQAHYSAQMIELRRFLVETIAWQAEFMAQRLENALPRMLAQLPPAERPIILAELYRIAATPQGVYVLVDYVNFKGEGLGRNGEWVAHSWGLLQVLEEMRYAPLGMSPLRAFAWAANRVLTQRVRYEPPWRDDGRWLAGWRKRLRTYYIV